MVKSLAIRLLPLALLALTILLIACESQPE